MELNWKELILDPNGSISHTKLWSNIGMGVVTITYIIGTYMHGITPELMATYGGLVIFGRATSKYLDTKSVSTEG